MAEAVVLGSLLQFGFDKGFKLSTKILSVIIFFNSRCAKFKKILNTLKPTIDEICNLSSGSPSETLLRSIQDFQANLDEGLQLVEECEKTSLFDFLKKFRYAKRMKQVEKGIHAFIGAQLSPNILLSIKALPDHSNQLERLNEEIIFMASEIEKLRREISSLSKELFENTHDVNESGQRFGSFSVPNMPRHYVGFDQFLIELRKLVFDAHVNVVGVTGIGGRGKSTLARALCNDPQVKEYFGNRVVYITVSQTPNFENILETMWDKILRSPKPQCQNVEDACNKFQSEVSSRTNQRTLVVLDDVWSKSTLENLLFESDGYKTVVTTRDANTIPKQNETQLYPLPSMTKEHALSLFCLWAFGQETIPITHDEELVKQVFRECQSLPLALKVIGSYLRDQPSPAWENAKKKLSRGQVISECHKKNLLNRLKTSIDVLDNKAKQCFLDLGAFPEGQKICANALLDIWVYVREIDWDEAYVILLELAARNLVELKSNPWSSASHGHTYELYISQHDVMRDLALHLAMQDKTRLYTPQSHSGVPSKWTANRHHVSNAQIVSIDTGAVDDQPWSQLEFRETEALVLLLTAGGYSIPSLHTMQKLKVLIIHNYSSQRAELNGLDASLGLSQLRSLQLERLMVPSLHEYCTSLESLEKLFLSLCEGLGHMSGFDGERCFNFPRLSEIHIDHCCDLEELPMGICHLNSLEKLSVTNCHLLKKLPDDLGELALLQVLKLSACPSLKTLPQSICKLERLDYLDISHCGCLKEFPKGFGELCSLKKLDMRECSRLKHGYDALAKVASLKHVVCDKRNEQYLKSICKADSSTLTVQVMEEPLSLDWLLS